jgi:hypothetical protein
MVKYVLWLILEKVPLRPWTTIDLEEQDDADTVPEPVLRLRACLLRQNRPLSTLSGRQLGFRGRRLR